MKSAAGAAAAAGMASDESTPGSACDPPAPQRPAEDRAGRVDGRHSGMRRQASDDSLDALLRVLRRVNPSTLDRFFRHWRDG